MEKFTKRDDAETAAGNGDARSADLSGLVLRNRELIGTRFDGFQFDGSDGPELDHYRRRPAPGSSGSG